MKRNEVAERIALMLHEAGFTLMPQQYDIPLKNLGIDMVELIMDIEEAYNISLFIDLIPVIPLNFYNLIDFVTQTIEIK